MPPRLSGRDDRPRRCRQWLRPLVLLLALGLPWIAAAQVEPDTTHLELRFLDVGQGDAILIRIGPHAVLVDASRGDDIVLYLEGLGIDSLVAAIASHNHDDHIGGMDAVLDHYRVGRYYSNQRQPENASGVNVKALLVEKDIDAPPPPWPPILLGDTRISIFPSAIAPDDATENNSSLGVLVERGTFRALLTGDSEVEELNAWMEAGVIPRVTLLKAAHHGARNGVTPGWLMTTKPDVVVISVGASNSYGHPDPWSLRYYAAGGRTVYRTDRDGTVIVSVDASGQYSVSTMGPLER